MFLVIYYYSFLGMSDPVRLEATTRLDYQAPSSVIFSLNKSAPATRETMIFISQNKSTHFFATVHRL
jgi:hypothetical protein